MTPQGPIAKSLGRAARATVTFFALAIALYALSYLFRRERAFPPDLAASFLARPWGIYPHALFGAVALALGSVQFWRGFPYSHPAFHRTLGKIYVVAALGTGTAGLYMSFFAFGGAVTQLGFGLLAVSVLGTTMIAYRRIRRRDVARHREWMLRSYALIFAAVTLRIELPILIGILHGFAPAYSVVAWLCWLPNLVLAELYVTATRSTAGSTSRSARTPVPS
ncbi:MAG TPA: DUF2306 domain-containing protein [Thermoanaerobaculia bacterium]|jgi:uncharacterized membrane protein